MQALNHTVFGTLVAVTINEPLVAIPVALGSHFVMDIIPHYGNDPRAARGSKAYNFKVVIDALASILILLFFISLHPANTSLVVICALATTFPDFLWPLALYIRQRGPLWAFFKFHKRIQRESRVGIFVELGWFLLTTTLVIYEIHHRA